jgi:hypothetical protein
MDQKYIIVDLDGTIALIDHRRHYVAGDKKNWEAFYQACVADQANGPVIRLMQCLHTSGYIIYIFSGRSKIVELETRNWLSIHEVPYFRLKMREVNDTTPDEILKLKWYKELGHKIEFTIDDRDKVVQMWRMQGIPCFQVAYGDF